MGKHGQSTVAASRGSLMDLSVHDNRERSRYEIVGDGRLIGFADYRIVGDAVEFPHTEITPPLRGRGYGAHLVGEALDAVRASGRRAVPLCSFVVEYVNDHPGAVDVVPDPNGRGARS
jgi:uncharacterized protein